MSPQEQDRLDLQTASLLRIAEQNRLREAVQPYRSVSFIVSVNLVDGRQPVTVRESFLAPNSAEALQSFCYACAIDPRDIVSMTITKAAP